MLEAMPKGPRSRRRRLVGVSAGLAVWLVVAGARGAMPAPPEKAVPHCALAGPDLEVSWRGEARHPRDDEQRAAPLRQVADVPLSGSASRFDYQSLDPERGRLYIAHMGAGDLVVFDLRSQTVSATLGGFPRATGVLAVPSEGRVYVSAAGSHELAVVDAATLRVVARLGGIRFPDGIAYVPGLRRVFVSDESGGRDLAIDAARNTILAKVGLGGEAGNTRYDPVSGCVLVAVQTADRIAVIEPTSLAVVRRVHLRGIDSPHGLLVDPDRRLLFVAGTGNATLGVLDADTLEPVDRAPVGDDPDVLAVDREAGRLYVASESGVVSVFGIHGRAVVPEGRWIAPRAHSVAVDSTTHRVYLPLANVGGRPVLRILEPTVNGP
jgi:DNA-binding beta-propeller fold protein YncE